jgi:hypothetical protein
MSKSSSKQKMECLEGWVRQVKASEKSKKAKKKTRVEEIYED